MAVFCKSRIERAPSTSGVDGAHVTQSQRLLLALVEKGEGGREVGGATTMDPPTAGCHSYGLKHPVKFGHRLTISATEAL